MAEDIYEQLRRALPEGMWKDARDVAEKINNASNVEIATHIDADGISAAAIAATALERAKKDFKIRYFKKLDDEAVSTLANDEADVVWFTDLGSGSISRIEGMDAVVTDHHMPDPKICSRSKGGQTSLSDFSTVSHLNPQVHGISGANDLSGAGSTFVAALAADSQNIDLSWLAVLGAVGDLQDQRSRRLEGLNRSILSAAEHLGLVEATTDIRYFGRETRPLHKLLEFSSDPFLPRISGNDQAARSFLLELGIELKDGERWRSWTDLGSDERERITEALQDHLRSCKRTKFTIDRLIGEVYTFRREQKGTSVRDAKEFATLLNACGRHGKAEVGLRICRGDRGDALSQGAVLLRDHRSAISKALAWAKGSGIVRMKNIQFFEAGDEIEDTIVGTVAGMLLGSEGADRTVPMIAFAESTEYSAEPKSKASGRGTQELVARGMDLSVALRTAAERVGGVGGGHSIAAGATIPADKKKEFLKDLDDLVGVQLIKKAPR